MNCPYCGSEKVSRVDEYALICGSCMRVIPSPDPILIERKKQEEKEERKQPHLGGILVGPENIVQTSRPRWAWFQFILSLALIIIAIVFLYYAFVEGQAMYFVYFAILLIVVLYLMAFGVFGNVGRNVFPLSSKH